MRKWVGWVAEVSNKQGCCGTSLAWHPYVITTPSAAARREKQTSDKNCFTRMLTKAMWQYYIPKERFLTVSSRLLQGKNLEKEGEIRCSVGLVRDELMWRGSEKNQHEKRRNTTQRRRTSTELLRHTTTGNTRKRILRLVNVNFILFSSLFWCKRECIISITLLISS